MNLKIIRLPLPLCPIPPPATLDSLSQRKATVTNKPGSPPLGVLSIATNVYLTYWKALATSIDQRVSAFGPITFDLFTDQAQDARVFARSLKRITVVVHEIEP